MMCRGAWWMDSSCSGDVSAMSTSARISFSTTSQRLGLFRTLRTLWSPGGRARLEEAERPKAHTERSWQRPKQLAAGISKHN
ncbi:hypothetical protein EYF80_036724 [Liparis tanakae]|uniref:Uncharacterized protein n=1 Tax=Liparis tanakae TaxID=230148 RepID=A0A4Z2GIK1_9TELE|nr:hypothetical protein EYF80_036724 [Liparis tanakae]